MKNPACRGSLPGIYKLSKLHWIMGKVGIRFDVKIEEYHHTRLNAEK